MAWLVIKWFGFLLAAYLLGALTAWGLHRPAKPVARPSDEPWPTAPEMRAPLEAPPRSAPQPMKALAAAPFAAEPGAVSLPDPARETFWRDRMEALQAQANIRHSALCAERDAALAAAEEAHSGQQKLISAHAADKAALAAEAESARAADRQALASLGMERDSLAERLSRLETRALALTAELDTATAALASQNRSAAPPAMPMRDWRGAFAQSRIQFLEARLAAAARRAPAEPTPESVPESVPSLAPLAAPDADPAATAEARARWRERYVTVRFERMAAAHAAIAAENDELRAELTAARRETHEAIGFAAHQAEAEEDAAAAPPLGLTTPEAEAAAERLRWRTRYLEDRVARLESEAATRQVPTRAAPAEIERERLRQTNLFLRGQVGQLQALLAERARGAPPPIAAPAESAPEAPEVAPHRPPALDAPRQVEPDDLQRIIGVGPVNEAKLHALGVYHFDQIAAWTPGNIAWVEAHLHFPGRIGREDWIGQARRFASARQQ